MLENMNVMWFKAGIIILLALLGVWGKPRDKPPAAKDPKDG
jgi:hypothetical protein